MADRAPLPPVDEHWMTNGHKYTADQLEAYGAACRAAALEEAARVCDSVDNHSNPMTASDCADAIRALKDKQ